MLFNITTLSVIKAFLKNVCLSFYASDICLWSLSVRRDVAPVRLQKVIHLSQNLASLGLCISTEKSMAMAFTRKLMQRYEIVLVERQLPCIATHCFFGIILDQGLTFTPEINRMTNKIKALIQVLRYMAGTSWGCSCHAMFTSVKALVGGTIRYSASVLHTPSLLF